MGKVTPIYRYYTLSQGDIVYPVHDERNMLTTDNSFGGLYTFVGPGVIEGWEVIKFSYDPLLTEQQNNSIRAEQISLFDAYNSDPNSYLGRRIISMNMQPSISTYCKVATTTNLGSLSGLITIDGVTLSDGEFVLVKNQTDKSSNGIYVASSSSWSRHEDLDSSSDFVTAKNANFCYWVSNGLTNSKTIWTLNLDPNDPTQDPDGFVLNSSYILFQNAFEQCVKVTTGNGIVGPYRAYTEEVVYFRYFEKNIYYVWAGNSPCLASEGKSTIISPLDPDYEYNLYHTATYLASVQVNEYSGENGVNAYVDLVEYDDRRTALKNLAGAFEAALRRGFYKHIHLGGNNHPSKINLSTTRILIAKGPIGSTIFLTYEVVDGIEKRVSSWKTTDYGYPEVRLNNQILPSSAYYLDSSLGKIYLKNSLKTTAFLQIILPLSPQIKLYVKNTSSISAARITLTDLSVDANGNQNTFRWDSGLYLEPLVYLDDVLQQSSIYSINSGAGTITFSPSLSPSSYTNSSLLVFLERIGREITGQLPGNRLKDLSAGLFTKGLIDPRRIAPLDHIGQVRYLENTFLSPQRKLFSAGDHRKFYPELTNQDLQYTTEILKILQSSIINSTFYMTKRGLMKSNNPLLVNLSTWNIDNGEIIDLSDDILRSSEGSVEKPSNRTYVLTSLGTVYYTDDKGSTWRKFTLPVTFQGNVAVPVFATAILATTNKEPYEENNQLKFRYSTTIYLGTTEGLYTAFAYRGEEFVWSNVWESVESPKIIYSIAEVVTQHIEVSNGSENEYYDRTIFIGSSKGFSTSPDTGVYSASRLISSEIARGFLIIKSNSPNDLLWFNNQKVYISHTARKVEERVDENNYSKYWIHPLASWNSTSYSNRISVVVATKSNLSANYNNGTSGLNATLTNNSTQSVIKIDGLSLSLGQRVLVKDQTNQAHNGVYTVSNVGSNSTNWVLTRYSSMTSSSWVEVSSGDSWARYIFRIVGLGNTITYNTDPIIFEEFWANPIMLPDDTKPFKDAVERINTNQYAIVNTHSPWIITDTKTPGESIWQPLSFVKSLWDSNDQPLLNTIYHFNTKNLYVGTKEGLFLSSNSDSILKLILSNDLGPSDSILFVTEPSLLFGYTSVLIQNADNKEILTIDVESEENNGIIEYTINITSPRTSSNSYSTTESIGYILVDGYKLSNAIWKRPINIFNDEPISSLYYEDKLKISSDRAILEGLVPSEDYALNTNYQLIKFYSDQKLGQSFILESDFKDYYTYTWYPDANVIVYVNDSPAEKLYTLSATEGKISFTQSLSSFDKVRMTIIKLNAYLTNVGSTPHEELLNALVSSDSALTVLNEPLPANAPAGSGVTVADPLQVPLDTSFIELRNSNLGVSEFLQVKVEPDSLGSRTITLLAPRSNNVTLPITTTSIFGATLQNLPGIEDKISLIQSNQYYHLNSIAGSNLLQLSISSGIGYTNLFNNFSTEPDPVYTKQVKRGPVNSLFYDFSKNETDTRNSSSTFYIGLQPSSTNVSTQPRTVYIMNNASSSGSNMRLGTDKGIWIFDGSMWKKESSLNNANKIYFISNQPTGSYLMAGTNIGLYMQQSDNTWIFNPTYPQAIYAYTTGEWEKDYTFFAYGKEDGLAFVRQKASGEFISDHFNDLDGYNVYGLHKNKFFRFVGTGDNKKQTEVDGLYLCTNVGLYGVCSGNASSRGEFASILVGREMFGDNPNNVIITTPNGNQLTVPVKYYKIFQSPRPKSVPLIILSSNGVYTVRNWRWCDPDSSQEDLKDFVVENHSIVGISCNSYATATETSVTGEVLYKIFVGTNKGVYRSYDEARTFEKCERINGRDLAINDLYSLSSTCLLAATDNGIWYSNDDGDNWYRTDENPETGSACTNFTRYINNAQSFNGSKLGQTFKASTANITKVSLYLSRKEISEGDPSLDNTLEVAIYNTSGGLPTGLPLATTFSTTNSVSWAPGYQASSGFNPAPRLYDNSIYDNSTYYESTSGLTFAGITAVYDMTSNKAVNRLVAKVYYTQTPTIVFEYSDDNITWFNALNQTIDAPVHAGSGRWENIFTEDIVTSSHRYWRISIKDDISDPLKIRVTRLGDFRLYYIDTVDDIGRLKQHLLPEKFTAADIKYPGFKSFIINVTGLTVDDTYALVATETIATGGTSVINWVKSNIQGY